MVEKANILKKVLEGYAEKDGTIEAKDYSVRYTNDVVASCILGIQDDAIRNADSTLRGLARRVFDPAWKVIIKAAFSFLVPDLAGLIQVSRGKPQVDTLFTN